MVYADGELIHSQTPREEFIEKYIKEEPERKKERSGLGFPFIMILLIAVCMAVILPFMEKRKFFEKQRGGAPAGGRRAGCGIRRRIDRCTLCMEIRKRRPGLTTWRSENRLRYYKTVDRKRSGTTANYVTDPSDDESGRACG
jgi:hypothetical protein